MIELTISSVYEIEIDRNKFNDYSPDIIYTFKTDEGDLSIRVYGSAKEVGSYEAIIAGDKEYNSWF